MGGIDRVVSVADIVPFFRLANAGTISRGTTATVVFRGTILYVYF